MGLKTKEKKTEDRLSRYFKDLNESDLDSDESSEESDSKEVPKKSQLEETEETFNEKEEEDLSSADQQTSETKAKASSLSVQNQKLPSANDCLGRESNPAFLKLNQKREINWDRSSLNLLEDETSGQNVDYKSNAVPPPSSYEPVTDPGIKVVTSDGKKRKSEADDLADKQIASKTCRLEGEESQQTGNIGS